MKREGEKFAVILSMLLLLFIWCSAALIFQTNILPNPLHAITQFLSDLKGDLLRHLARSSYRLFAGVILGCIPGMALGLFIGSSRKRDCWCAPLIYVLYVVPKIVLFPLFVVVLGIEDVSKICLIATVVFFQVLVMTRDAIRGIDPRYIYSMQSLGKTQLQLYWHLFFCCSLPTIFTALKISLGTALAVLFLVENFASDIGVGYYIMNGMTQFNYSVVFSGIIGMSLIGMGMFLFLDYLELRFCPWIFFDKK